MYQHTRKAWLRGRLQVAAAVAMAGLMASCSEDMEPWEAATLTVEDYSSSLSAAGGSFTLDIETNTVWRIDAPEWVTVDPASGEGNAVVTVTVQPNIPVAPESNERRERVVLMAGYENGEELVGNIAGCQTHDVWISQAGAFEDFVCDIGNATFTRTTEEVWDEEQQQNVRHDSYNGVATYTIDSWLSNEQLASIFGEVDIRFVCLYRVYDSHGRYETYERECFRMPVEWEKGEHDLTVSFDLYDDYIMRSVSTQFVERGTETRIPFSSGLYYEEIETVE